MNKHINKNGYCHRKECKNEKQWKDDFNQKGKFVKRQKLETVKSGLHCEMGELTICKDCLLELLAKFRCKVKDEE